MGRARYDIAGRVDGDAVRHVEQFPEATAVAGAALAPDRYEYEVDTDRCIAETAAGRRCRGKRVKGSRYCMVHYGQG